jgi:glutamate synthase domain-containing protein 3
MIDIEPLTSKKDIIELKKIIQKHYEYTGSRIAGKILDNWKTYILKFVKVMPLEYRKVLGLMTKQDRETKREEVGIG